MKYRYLLILPLLFIAAGCDSSGDRVLVCKFSYDSGLSPARRYDVVVFKYPDRPIENGTPKNYIKRLLGLPGEILAIFFGRLFAFSSGGTMPACITKSDWDQLTEANNRTVSPFLRWICGNTKVSRWTTQRPRNSGRPAKSKSCASRLRRCWP